jgi:hypothetical protein
MQPVLGALTAGPGPQPDVALPVAGHVSRPD